MYPQVPSPPEWQTGSIPSRTIGPPVPDALATLVIDRFGVIVDLEIKSNAAAEIIIAINFKAFIFLFTCFIFFNNRYGASL